MLFNVSAGFTLDRACPQLAEYILRRSVCWQSRCVLEIVYPLRRFKLVESDLFSRTRENLSSRSREKLEKYFACCQALFVVPGETKREKVGRKAPSSFGTKRKECREGRDTER